MAMFARRVLKRCIDESFSYASNDVRRTWVKKLNSSSEPAYAATEWEIVVLHTIAQFGTLRHEPLLVGGSSKLDVVFGNSAISFGADITTISDRGLDEKNPISELEKRLKDIYEASEISSGGIDFRVIDISQTMGRYIKGSSIIPPKNEFDNIIFNDSFFRWISSLKTTPNEKSVHQIIYRNPVSQIIFTYTPGNIGIRCSGYTNYRMAKSLKNNPLHNALVSKASQLKHSGYSGASRYHSMRWRC